MRINKIPLAAAMASFITGCSGPSGANQGYNGSPPPFLPSATIQELMDSEVDAAADFIWGSVGTVITAAGTEERQPTTEEEWLELRRHAIVLTEATNLLLIPGRKVAKNPFPSAGPGVLSSAQIDAKIAGDRAGFDTYALALREVALQEVKAIDDKDSTALTRAGEAMDGVCEACHLANWYPHEVIPVLPDFMSIGRNGRDRSVGLPND